MTTPTNPTLTAAELFRTELKAQLDALDTKIESMRADIGTDLEAMRAELQQMREGLSHAASQPTVGTFAQMEIVTIVMGYSDDGKPTYKAKGQPYQKHGVRVWPEILPTLGIDPATLKPGTNQLETPIIARVLMGETTNQETGEKGTGPRKVTGKA